MSLVKTDDELARMKEAGRIVALAHQAIADAIKPGISTKELDAIAYRVITEHGAVPSFLGYYEYPASICASCNDAVVHGIPNETRLKDGDLISIDIGACYKGYHGDSAWTYAVGGVSKAAEELMDTVKEALFQGLAQAKAGNRLGDISHAIAMTIHRHGFTIPQDLTGHGIGTALHEEPSVPNAGDAHTGLLLKEGMTLAIEPMAHMGKPQTRIMPDGWTVKTKDGSLAAHYEHSIVITKTGYEILTKIPDMEVSNGKTRCH